MRNNTTLVTGAPPSAALSEFIRRCLHSIARSPAARSIRKLTSLVGLTAVGLFPMAVIATPSVFDANSLTISASSGDSTTVSSNAGASNGDMLIYMADAVGDFVTFNVTVPAADTYTVAVRYHRNPNRGTIQLAINGTNQGTAKDLYDSAGVFEEFDLGNVALTAGTTAFKFTVTGHNASSSSYRIALDTITLTTVVVSPPAAPSSLASTSIGSTSINLTWNDNSSNEDNFLLQRKTGTGGPYATIASPAPNSASLTDASLTASTTYVYRIAATNTGGTSAYSNELTATTTSGGGSSGVTFDANSLTIATSSGDSTTVNSNSGASNGDMLIYMSDAIGDYVTFNLTVPATDTYTVAVRYHRNPNRGTVQLAINGTNQGTAKDLYDSAGVFEEFDLGNVALTAGTTAFKFTVTGHNASSSSYRIALDTITLTPVVVSPPAAPSSLVASAPTASTLALSWADNSANETAFNLERKLTSGGTFAQIASLSANTTSYADTGLSPSTSYTYRVAAANAGGTSVFSNEASATTTAGGGSSLRAFPTAVGYGAFATGGRGGLVKFVTNLNDSGPGSLREAMGGTAPCTVIFRVGGLIQLQSALQIDRSNLTIAGQTAPGDGITLAGDRVRVANASDVIIRHIASRPGNVGTGLDNRDALQIEHAQRVIIDHCSFSWSTDELLTGWFSDTSDYTVQNSIVSEPLWNAGHSKGSHPMGLLIGRGVPRVTLYRNYMAHVGFRTPEFSTGNVIDVVNNIVHNWGQRGVTWSPGQKEDFGPSSANIMNNIFQPGDGHDGNGSGNNGPAIVFMEKVNPWAGTQIHISGNENGGGVAANAIQGDFNGGNYAPVLSSVPVPAAPYDLTVAPVSTLVASLLPTVGRTIPARDAVDARLVSDYSAGISRRPNSPADVGGYPTLQSGTPYPDADADGMDDNWETAKGLNPADPNDRNGDRDNDGYTNLEEFLNGLAGDYPLY